MVFMSYYYGMIDAVVIHRRVSVYLCTIEKLQEQYIQKNASNYCVLCVVFTVISILSIDVE